MSRTPYRNMAGVKVCETCHPVQTEFWKTTGHSAAYTTLVQKKKHLDLECLPCHLTLDPMNPLLATGTHKEFLFFPEELQSVGCESCHGIGKDHSSNPDQIKIARLPGKKICLRCHTTEHDDNFDYKTKLSQISCPAE